MNGWELLEKMELIEPAYVQEADVLPVRRRKIGGVWAAAACVCLLLGVLLWPRSGTITPEPQVGDFELSEGTTAKVTVGIDDAVSTAKTDLEWLDEEELFRQEGLYAFRGRVSGLTNVTIDFNGDKEIRCVATVAVEKVYCGEVEEGEQIAILLPCPAGASGRLWVEDTGIASQIESGMEGIFMPRAYREDSYWEQNGATLMLSDLAPCGLWDGMRWLFLETERGLVYEKTAYPGAAGAVTLDDIEEYVVKMLG